MASVGQPAGGSSVSSDPGADAGTSGDTSGSATASDGTTMASGDTTAGTAVAGDGGATGSGAGTGAGQTPTSRTRRPILVTAGNAVLDVAGRTDALRGPLNDNLPNSAPITGTVTQVLADTGQALVRAGDGSSYLVDGLAAAPGAAVTIAAGNAQLVGGPGSNPLIGVSVISPTQTAGSVASVGVGSGGTLLTATVPGSPAVAGLPAAVTGATGGLANATAGTTELAGNGQPATFGVSALSPTQADGSVLTAGVASGGSLVTVNGTSVGAPSTADPLAGASATAAGAAGAVGATTGTLVDANAGGTQLIGGGQPAAVGVSALSPTQTGGSVLTAGVASGGSLATVNGTSIAAPTTGGLTAPGVTAPGVVAPGVALPAVSIGGTTTVAVGPLTLH